MKKSSHSLGKLFLWLLLLIIFIGIIEFFLNPTNFEGFIASIAQQVGLGVSSPQSYSPSPALISASKIADSGDLDAANRAAQQVLAGGSTNQADIFAANLLKDAANAAAATTSVAQLASLQTMLQDYHQAKASTAPFYVAWTLNSIVRGLLRGDTTLIAAIAADPVLSSYAASGDLNKTVSNLAQYSFSIYPTSDAAYFAARSAQTYILQNYTTTGNATVTANLKSAATNIQDWLSRGDPLLAIESQSNQLDVLSYTEVPWTTLTRASLLSTLALLDKNSWTDAHAAYQTIYDYYKNTRDSNGNQLPLLLQPVASARLLEAYYLYHLDSKANAGAIALDLNEFVVAVKANPDLEQSLIASINDLTIVQQGKAAFISSHSPDLWPSFQNAYDMYVYYAKISPTFKAFLQSQGWKLN